MAYFAPIMISTAYDQRRETVRFAQRKESFRFCRFSGSSRPKTQGSEINGGFGARVADVARAGDSEMAAQAIEIAQRIDPGELRMRRFAHNLRRKSIFFIFLAITL
jgi:hypothetical protein